MASIPVKKSEAIEFAESEKQRLSMMYPKIKTVVWIEQVGNGLFVVNTGNTVYNPFSKKIQVI